MICSCLRILHLPKAKTARTKSRFDRDGKVRSHFHTLRNPASGSRQGPPKPLCPTLFFDERILRADSGQERTTAGRCPVTHGSRPTFDQYHRLRIRGTEVRTEKNGHFSAGQSAGNLSLHGGKPARAACKRRETDKTAPILHRVLPDKASPHKEAINEKQKIMEKKQSTALEKADTATLTLSILFVVSILCTILFSLTA